MAAKQYERLKDYLESEWDDFNPSNQSPRLNSLYSDFTKLSVLNEYGYKINVDYWRTVLLGCSLRGYLCYHGYTLVLDKSSLAQDFMLRRVGKPLALDCVLDSMEKEGVIISLHSYERTYATSPSTWSSWLWNRMTPTFLTYHSDTSSLYVVLPSIKTISHCIYENYTRLPVKTITNSLLTFSDFRKQYNGIDWQRSLTDNDLILVLKYMASQSLVAIEDGVRGYGSGSFMVIKFIEPNMPYKVTDQDKAMISIRTTCDALRYQTQELQQQAERLAISAQEHHHKKQKPQTLYALRRKRHILDVLDKRLKSLGEMEHLLLKMESAQDDLQIVQAFDNGAKALQGLFASGLSVQSVEETMARIQEAYDEQKDVDQAMVDGSTSLAENGDTQYDDELLLKELEELEESETRRQHDKVTINERQTATWPSVPSESLPSSLSSDIVNSDEHAASLDETAHSSPSLVKKESGKVNTPRVAQLE
ncbi:Snf7-domain-containing protein [Chlamydoabsidia padenii]|nr:Snf7-domain-containing protein [Chlamydoabsidia padenii]